MQLVRPGILSAPNLNSGAFNRKWLYAYLGLVFIGRPAVITG
jgi:hypothetical protein